MQPKAIAYPTDARLLNRMRERLVEAAQRRGIKLRQSYRRVGKVAFVKQNRYRHAQQHKRAATQTCSNTNVPRRWFLRTYLGRVRRDLARKVSRIDEELAELFTLADRLLAQRRQSKHKLYSIHAPEVYCISKGKPHRRYELGCKVSVVTASNWILAAQASSSTATP